MASHQVHACSAVSLCDPMDYSLPGSSVLEILQIRIWSGLPFPFPGNLSIPGIEPVSPVSPVLADSVTTEPSEKSPHTTHQSKF